MSLEYIRLGNELDRRITVAERRLEKKYRDQGVFLRMADYKAGVRVLSQLIAGEKIPSYGRATVFQAENMGRRSPVPLDRRHVVVYCALRELDSTTDERRLNGERAANRRCDQELMAHAVLAVSGPKAFDLFKRAFPNIFSKA
jgi:hypothetical protein